MSKVAFEIDEENEMLYVSLDGDILMSGNFWDFSFKEDVPYLLKELGIDFEELDVRYED